MMDDDDDDAVAELMMMDDDDAWQLRNFAFLDQKPRYDMTLRPHSKSVKTGQNKIEKEKFTSPQRRCHGFSSGRLGS